MKESQELFAPEQHLHGPNCGHLSIGSLLNVCLKADKGDFGLHKLTPQCRAGGEVDCWTGSQQFSLERVSFNECQIRGRNCAPHHTSNDEEETVEKDHEHHPSQSRVFKHDGHLDVLVGTLNGDLDVHCKQDANYETCHVHGSLQRVKPDALIPSKDWLDLFVFSNQTSTSTIKVYKGLCCKKEIPKIEQLLSDICQQYDLKIQVDAKQKLVTVWHGSDIKSWLSAMCDRLCTGVFKCHLNTVNGEVVSSCIVSEMVQVEDAMLLLHVGEDLNGIRVQYLLQNEKQVLNQLVGGNLTCNLIQLNNLPVFAHQVQIIKGLCCKKEIPKVEHALEHVSGLALVRVHPKDKFVVTFTTQVDFALDGVHNSLIQHGFGLHELPLVLEPAEQEVQLPTPFIKKETPLIAHQQSRSVLSVKGVCCAAEVPSVLAICHEVPGVSFASVSVISKQVYFKHNDTDALVANLVAKRLTDNGFASMVLVNGGEPRKVQLNQQVHVPMKTSQILLTKWYVILATVLWAVAWLSYIGDGFDPLKYLDVVCVALTLPSIAYKGLRSLRRRIMDINVLMSIAVIGALALQDFHEAATVTVIFSWSEWLEERASRRAKGALQALVNLQPESARTEDGEEITVESVYVDQVLVVRSGDKFPVDGVLLSTSCDCDESNLTGESRPVGKNEGDLLNAGTLNVSPFMVKMQCTTLAENSAVSRMIRLVEEAAQSRSPTEQIVERVARIYTPLVVFIALLLATIPWSQGDEIGYEYLHIALTLLVVACPCALIISTPITYVCAMAQAAGFGVMVKGGKHLETLAVLDCLCCDKTGTLTKGQFEVSDYLLLNEANRTWAFDLLVKIEQHATHPIAQAIGRFSQQQVEATLGVSLEDVQVYELELLPGTGVKATLSTGSTATVVNKLDADNCTPSEMAVALPWLEKQVGKTICWLVVDGQVLLGLSASDQIRDSASKFVHQLHKLGVRVVVLTGDNSGSAQLLQREIPTLVAQDVFAQLSPEGKVDHVKRLKNDGHVVGVCGDGVNDAPAFSIASVGIAMGVGGAPLAIETADVALMDNDLTKIARLLKLSKKTKRVIVQNVTFALSTKMVMLGLTFAGMISLGVAIAVDVGSMLLVTLNGVRLLEHKPNPTPITTTAVAGEEDVTHV
ncbi:hypothetical protein BASA81_002598 [Batrachochytrium salamandrivorans]|nr:hypothetical protein BASA81_002598 [Batrachochytrium salamandrivorans]